MNFNFEVTNNSTGTNDEFYVTITDNGEKKFNLNLKNESYGWISLEEGQLKWTPLSRQKIIKVKLVYIHLLWKTRNGKTKPCGKLTKTNVHKGFSFVENLWKTCG